MLSHILIRRSVLLPVFIIGAAFSILPTTSVSAQTLTIAIPESVTNTVPVLTQRILQTLQKTGYTIEKIDVPNKRSKSMMAQGKVALEILRSPEVSRKIPNIIAIQPPVLSLTIAMVTSALTPQYCDASEDDFKTMLVAGVHGLGIHEEIYFPQFNHSHGLTDFMKVVQFVALQRANVSFLPMPTLASLPDDVKETIIVCDHHRKTYVFNTYLHQDFLWAKEKIEDAYRSEFTTPASEPESL